MPCTAAHDAAFARTINLVGGPIGRLHTVGGHVTVFRPLPDIACDIMNAECIGFERSNRRNNGMAVVAGHGVPGAQTGGRLVKVIGDRTAGFGITAPGIVRGAAATGHIFPFRFRRQAIGLAGPV